MKKLILINSYCDDNSKLEILSTYIDSLKESNFDIFLYSPIDLPEYITNKCNFLFKTTYNPISNNVMTFWDFFDNLKLIRYWQNFAWSSVYQYKILSDICNSFDYDIYYYTIYDVKLNQDIINFINTNDRSYFFQFKRQDKYSDAVDIRNCAMQFFCLIKEDVSRFNSLVNEDDLLSFDCAESYLYDLSKKLNVSVHDNLIIEDIVCTWFDFFNFSVFNDFSLFFSSDKSKILFYNINFPITIDVKIDNENKILNINTKYFELPFGFENKEVIIKYNKKELDIMKKIKKINCDYEIG